MTHPTHPTHPNHPHHPPIPTGNNTPNAKVNMYIPILFALGIILIKKYANKITKKT